MLTEGSMPFLLTGTLLPDGAREVTNQPELTVNHGDEVGVNPPIDTSNNISPSTKGSGQVNHPYLK